MAKKAVKKVQATKEKKQRQDPRIEEIYEQEVEFICPVRGKVKQIVKIKRYKPLDQQDSKHVLSTEDAIDKLEEKDDGLSIYTEADLDSEET